MRKLTVRWLRTHPESGRETVGSPVSPPSSHVTQTGLDLRWSVVGSWEFYHKRRERPDHRQALPAGTADFLFLLRVNKSLSFQLSPPAVCQSVSPEDALEDVWRMTFFDLVIPWLGTEVPRGPPKGCSLPSVLSLARLHSNTGGAILPQDSHAQGTGALAGEILRVFNPWCLSMDAGHTHAGSWTPLQSPGLGGRRSWGRGWGRAVHSGQK